MATTTVSKDIHTQVCHVRVRHTMVRQEIILGQHIHTARIKRQRVERVGRVHIPRTTWYVHFDGAPIALRPARVGKDVENTKSAIAPQRQNIASGNRQATDSGLHDGCHAYNGEERVAT